jgi:hypothetical protein
MVAAYKVVLTCSFMVLCFDLFAQALTVDQQRSSNQRIFRFHNWGTAQVQFDGAYDYTGFHLTAGVDSQSLSCDKIKEYAIELAIIIDQVNNNTRRWESYLARCAPNMRSEFQLIWLLPNANFESTADFQKYLKHSSLTQERSENILRKVQRFNETKRYRRKFLIAFEEFLKTELADLKNHERHKLLSQAHEVARTYQSELPYLSQLMELAIALKTPNLPRARRLLHEFLNRHPFRLVFEVNPAIFNETFSKERYDKFFLELGLLVGRSLRTSNPVEVDAFMTVLSDINKTRLFDSLVSTYGTDWSLVRLRDQMAKRRYGQSFPSFWYQQLSFRTSMTLIEGYVENLMTERAHDDLLREFMWVYVDDFPRRAELRNRLIEVITNSELDPYLEYVILEMIEQPSLKQKLSQNVPKYARPQFSLRREYFRSLMLEGLTPEFALLNLFKLGDLDSDYLWLIALSRTF